MKNVAVVGFGFMGMTHTLSILKIKDLRLVAIVDQDVEGIEKKLKKARFYKKSGFAQTTTALLRTLESSFQLGFIVIFDVRAL